MTPPPREPNQAHQAAKKKPQKDEEKEQEEVQEIGEEEEDEEDEEEQEEEEPKVGDKRKPSKLQQVDASYSEVLEKSPKVVKQKAMQSTAEQFKPPT